MVHFKSLQVGVLLLLVLCESAMSVEEKPRKNKKYKNDNLSKKFVEDVLVEPVDNGNTITENEPAQMNIPQELNMHEQLSPCQKKHCGAGRVCKLTEEGEAECVCISDCPIETDERRKVCSNRNQTWGSDCEIYRMRCNCEEKSEKCTNPEFSHLHIEYYGSCKQMPVCTDSEMTDFPRRMREWLYHIMQDLADNEELNPRFKQMVKEGETNMTKGWSNAAVWKWCDLDGHPHDRAVSRHELFPIRAPLMYLEHCIAPFLNKCDANDDHMITLEEWGNCLEISKETLEEECDMLDDALSN